MPTVSTSLKLDADMKERVQKLATARKRTPHWLMKEAVEQYVDREEKREQFARDAEASWQHYKETGLHLTGDEVIAWLEELEKGNDVEPPACHT